MKTVKYINQIELNINNMRKFLKVWKIIIVNTLYSKKLYFLINNILEKYKIII